MYDLVALAVGRKAIGGPFSACMTVGAAGIITAKNIAR